MTMAEQSTNKFTWVIENFSELKDKACSSRFTIGGCNWRLVFYPHGDDDNQTHLSLYLDVENAKSLPSQWKTRARCTLSVVNQLSKNQTLTDVEELWFNANENDWGFPEYMPLTELKSPTRGFLMNNSVIIEVKIEVLEIHGNLDITADGVDAEETSSDESEADSTESNFSPSVDAIDAEETSSDESEVDSIEISSSSSEDAEEFEICKEVSSSKNPQEPLDAYEIVEADVAKSDGSSTSVCTSKNPSTKTELIFQMVDVNGFLIHDTQAEQVKIILERHPDLASNFRPKNQKLRTAYVNVLLDLIEALCRSPQDITEEDLSKGSNTLIDLEDIGLKLDWLKAKFDEVTKRKERAAGARIGELEKRFEKLKLMMSDVEAELEKEKEEVAAVRVPLSFNYFVS